MSLRRFAFSISLRVPVLAAVLLFMAFPVAHGQTSTGEAGSRSAPAVQTSGTSQDHSDQEERDANDEYRQSSVVRSLGSKMGMQPKPASTLFEVINFAVLAVFLGWVLARILPKAFRNRTTGIQKRLVDARTATEQASVRLNSVEDRLAKLDEQIAGLRAQAENDAATEDQRLRAAVDDEKRKIVESAEQEIAAATAQARKKIQNYAAELAIDGAAKRLVISAETDRLLVERFAERLGADGGKGGRN